MLRISLLLGICCLMLEIAAQDVILNQDYRVESFVSNETPYVGEQILYGFRYFTYAATEGLNQRLPDFEGFWVADIYEQAGGRIETIDNLQYVVRELFAEITPLQAGSIAIKPAVLEVPDTVFQQGGVLYSDEIVIHVQPLPENAPVDFMGAVGQFNAFTAFEPNRLTLGQPLTLTMTIDGTGNLEQLPAPRLPDVSGWRIYPNPSRYEVSELGNLRFGQKIYEWLVIPQEVGSQTFPAVVFSFFDPQLEEYRSIASSPFTVEVFPGTDNRRTLPGYDFANADHSQVLPLKAVTLTRAQNDPELIILVLWVIPPAILIGCAGWVYGSKIISHRQQESRKTKALQNTIHSLNTLPDAKSDKSSFQVPAIVENYIKDKSKVPRKHPINLSETLSAHHISPKLQKKLLEHITWIESLRFTPQYTTKNLHLDELIKLLKTLDTTWQ